MGGLTGVMTLPQLVTNHRSMWWHLWKCICLTGAIRTGNWGLWQWPVKLKVIQLVLILPGIRFLCQCRKICWRLSAENIRDLTSCDSHCQKAKNRNTIVEATLILNKRFTHIYSTRLELLYSLFEHILRIERNSEQTQKYWNLAAMFLWKNADKRGQGHR